MTIKYRNETKDLIRRAKQNIFSESVSNSINTLQIFEHR